MRAGLPYECVCVFPRCLLLLITLQRLPQLIRLRYASIIYLISIDIFCFILLLTRFTEIIFKYKPYHKERLQCCMG